MITGKDGGKLPKVSRLSCSRNKLVRLPLKEHTCITEGDQLPGQRRSWHSNQYGTYQHRWNGFGQWEDSSRTTWYINVSVGQLPPCDQQWWKHTITVTKCQRGHGSQPLPVRVTNVCSAGCTVCVCEHVKWGNKSKSVFSVRQKACWLKHSLSMKITIC